jgi:hypothetical protein
MGWCWFPSLNVCGMTPMFFILVLNHFSVEWKLFSKICYPLLFIPFPYSNTRYECLELCISIGVIKFFHYRNNHGEYCIFPILLQMAHFSVLASIVQSLVHRKVEFIQQHVLQKGTPWINGKFTTRQVLHYLRPSDYIIHDFLAGLTPGRYFITFTPLFGTLPWSSKEENPNPFSNLLVIWTYRNVFLLERNGSIGGASINLK